MHVLASVYGDFWKANRTLLVQSREVRSLAGVFNAPNNLFNVKVVSDPLVDPRPEPCFHCAR